MLLRHFPTSTVTVHNRGVGGQLATQMLARFDQDLWPLTPHLVLWQTGTNEALRRVAPEALRAALREGVERMRGRGVEVMLIDPQYSPDVERRLPDYERQVQAMRDFAREAEVPLIDRYGAMRLWSRKAADGSAALLAPDRLHQNDEGYRCLGTAVATAIACAAGTQCPFSTADRASDGARSPTAGR